MKGYDSVVFPQVGEPILIAMAPSQADAERTAWTRDIRYFPATTSAIRGRRRYALSSWRVRQPRMWPRRPRAVAGNPGRRPHGRRADDLHPGAGSTGRSPRRDAAPQRCARDQDRAGDRAHSPRQRHRLGRHGVRARARAARHEGKRGGGALERVRAQPRHRLEGKVELAHAFSLVWSGPGIRTFTSTSDRPVQENEPTLFEIWVCADGYWSTSRRTLPGKLTKDYDRLLDQLLVVYQADLDHCRPGAEPRAARRAIRPGSPRLGTRASLASGGARSRRACPRAALCAPGWQWDDRGRHGAGD